MDGDPVYVTFEFNGNLGEEVNRVTLGIRDLSDESAEMFKKLLQGSNETFGAMSRESQSLVAGIEKQIIELRNLAEAEKALDNEYKDGTITLNTYVEARARLTAQEEKIQAAIDEQTSLLKQQNDALRDDAAKALTPVYTSRGPIM
jgi:uncharacterized phage infection (PIP) family protein YhgE